MTPERSWRLLPSERVLWRGKANANASRNPHWLLGSFLLFAFATISGLFSALLLVAELPGAPQMLGMAAYLSLLGAAVAVAPRYLHDRCEYIVTDHRVIWRRGKMLRWIDRRAVSYARITWNSVTPGVGHLELVRAAPFGPLSRKQRLLLVNLIAPDHVYAIIRGVTPSARLGDPELSPTERLDEDERVVWGGAPEGWLLGWRDWATAGLGASVLWLAVHYGGQAWGVLVDLERLGLQVRSWTWLLLFLATALSFCVLAAIGSWLSWHGVLRARALGRDTEYMVTTRRVLIRRGRTELSIDRRGIVDVAVVPVFAGFCHVFLILDAPEASALSDSGAMLPLVPARDLVPPVLYELRETEDLCELLLSTDDPLRRAA